VDKGGDDVMRVKDHQPQLRADIALVCALPPAGDRQETARTVDRGHGRIEQRHRTTSAALVGDSAWPGLAQVCALGRYVMTQKTAAERVEVVYGVTRLRPKQGTPERLLALVRGHWQSENKSHGVRDVTFEEDRSQVRCGHIPQVMAALRHTTIGLLRWAGYSNIAAACRRFAAQPDLALTLIGIQLEN
jgi:predicted transposase YbfD/YdcC